MQIYKKYKWKEPQLGDEIYFYFENEKLVIHKAIHPFRLHPIGFISLCLLPIIILMVFIEPSNDKILVITIMCFLPGCLSGSLMSVLHYFKFYLGLRGWNKKVISEFRENKLGVKFSPNSILVKKITQNTDYGLY